MKLVRGRSRYPQSQGSVEAANKEIKRMLGTYRRENNTTHWAHQGLSMVQFQKNSSYHQSLKMTPCEALYGKKASQGLYSTGLEPSTFHQFVSEDDLNDYFEAQDIEAIEMYDDEQQVVDTQPTDAISMSHDEVATSFNESQSPTESQDIDLGEISTMDICPIEESSDIIIGECTICERDLMTNNMVNCKQCCKAVHVSCANSDICQLCCFINSRDEKRKEVSISQDLTAKKMTAGSDKRLAPLDLGENVRIPVEKVDRGLLDSPYLIGVITEKKHGNYRVGTTDGTLNQMFSRSQIDKCSHNFITTDQVNKEKVLSVRSANAAQSIGTGQGLERCTCLQGCKNNRCNCKRKGVLCSSHCHKSTACKNKS